MAENFKKEVLPNKLVQIARGNLLAVSLRQVRLCSNGVDMDLSEWGVCREELLSMVNSVGMWGHCWSSVVWSVVVGGDGL